MHRAHARDPRKLNIQCKFPETNELILNMNAWKWRGCVGFLQVLHWLLIVAVDVLLVWSRALDSWRDTLVGWRGCWESFFFLFLKERWELMRSAQRDPELSVQRIGLLNAVKLNVSCEGPNQTRRSEKCARTWGDCDLMGDWDLTMWHTQVTLTGRKRVQLSKSALWGKCCSFHVVNATSAGQKRTHVSLMGTFLRKPCVLTGKFRTVVRSIS